MHEQRQPPTVASPRERRLARADASPALLSGWGGSGCAGTSDPGIHGKLDASDPQGRRLRADAGAAFLLGWAVVTIPCHDFSGVTASEGVTGNNETVASGQRHRAEEEERATDAFFMSAEEKTRPGASIGHSGGEKDGLVEGAIMATALTVSVAAAIAGDSATGVGHDCGGNLVGSCGRSCHRGPRGERRVGGGGRARPPRNPA